VRCRLLNWRRRAQGGDAQTEGVDRAAVRGSEAVARDASVPAPGSHEGEYGGADDRGRTEPEAIAECDGMGTASMAQWSRRVCRFDVPNALCDGVTRDSPTVLRTSIGDSRLWPYKPMRWRPRFSLGRDLTGLSRRLLREWCDGTVPGTAVMPLSLHLIEAAIDIVTMSYPLTQADSTQRYAWQFATDLQRAPERFVA